MNEVVRHPVYLFEGFRLDAQRRLLFAPDGQSVALTPRLVDTLLYFVERPGQLLTKEALLEAIWPNVVVEEHNLNKTVSELRRILGETPGEHRFIVTKPGHGYRFVATVSIEAPASTAAASNERPVMLTEVPDVARRGSRPRWAAVAAVALVGVVGLGALSMTWNKPLTHLGSVVASTPLTTEPGAEIEPSWAPDGVRVAYSREGSIYVTQRGAGAPRRLTTPTRGQDRGPVWAPADERIAFLRVYEPTRPDLVVMDAVSGAELLRVPVRMRDVITQEHLRSHAWTPDGQRLLIAREDESEGATHGFHFVDAATGAIEPFRPDADPSHYDTSPAFSHDGRRLAFVRYRTGQRLSELMVQDLSADYRPVGAPRAVPGIPPGLPHSPSWSPDGVRLLFASNQSIYEWHPGEDAHVVTTTQLRPMNLSVSWQDGRVRVVGSFIETDLDLWRLPLDPLTHEKTGEPVTRHASTFGERHMRFSHDGRKLAFVSARSGRGELWIAEGDDLRRLTDHRAQILSSPRWSPDDRNVAYRISAAGRPNVMYVIDVVSGEKRELGYGSPSFWSGDYLYYDEFGQTERTITLMRRRMPDGEPERLFAGGLAVPSHDGTRVLYVKATEPGIFARTLAGDDFGDDEVRLVDDYVLMRGATAPVEGGFYYIGHAMPDEVPTAIKFYDFTSNAATDVHPVPLDVDIGMSVSPDGTELLFAAGSTGRQGDLTIYELEYSAPGASD